MTTYQPSIANKVKLLQTLLLAMSLTLLVSCSDNDGDDSSGTTTDTSTDTDSGSDTDSFVFPFRKGEEWTVCQGYNTPSITHIGDQLYSLDLSIDPDAASGATGCNFASANASTGYKVIAPVAARILWEGLTLGINSDVICLQLDDTTSNEANSMLLGHLTLDGLAPGDKVTMGQSIGTVNEASSFNGNYAHIHISMYKSTTCQGDSIPLDDVFDGDHNFTNDDSQQQWRGTVLSR